MENKFFTWDNFVDGFGKEVATAEDVYNRIRSMIQKILFPLFIPCLAFAQTDKSHIRYAPSCADTIIMEDIKNVFNAQAYFWGGDGPYLRYFKINLRQLLSDPLMRDGAVSIQVHVDTSGLATNVTFLKKLNADDTINDRILAAVIQIKKWKPSCYFDVLENAIVCKEIDIYANLAFRKGEVYIDKY